MHTTKIELGDIVNHKYAIGTILRITDGWNEKKKCYWKITDISWSYCAKKYYTYNCIKCNKNGKEFKEENGFGVTFIDTNETGRVELISDIPLSTEKVSTTNIKRGAKKRRLKFLKNKIETYKSEIAKLEKELEGK